MDLFQVLIGDEKSFISDVSKKLEERWKTKCDETDKISQELEVLRVNHGEELLVFI